MSIWFIAFWCFVIDFIIQVGNRRYRGGWSLVVSTAIIIITLMYAWLK